MTTPELIDYVKKGIEAGISRDLISDKLKAQGWNEIDITEVFSVVTGPITINDSTPKINPTLIPDLPIIQDKFVNRSVQNPSPEQNFQTTNPLDSSFIQPSKGGRVKKFLLLTIIVVILVGAIFAYGFGYFNNSSKLFSQIIDSSKSEKSLSYDINFSLDASGMKTDTMPNAELDKYKVFSLNTQGSSDFSDEDNLKLKNSILFKTSDVQAGIDFRIVNKSVYISLTKAPNLGFFSLEPFENKWIIFPTEDAAENLARSPLMTISSVNPSFLGDFTDEQKEKINEIAKKAKFIKITKKHFPKMVDGSLSHHFDFELDKGGTISFIKDMTEYVKTLNIEENGVTGIDLNTDYEKSIEAIENFHGEAWVGIFDKLPHKILINTEIVNPDKIENGSAKLALSIIYTDWGKSVEVEVPMNAMTIQELMTGVYEAGVMDVVDGSITEGNEEMKNTPNLTPNNDDIDDGADNLVLSKEQELDLSIMNIINSIKTRAQSFYSSNENSYERFCSSKIKDGAYTIAITLPKNTIYKCKDSVSEWVSFAKLTGNEYWCVDSTGFFDKIKKIPNGMSCSN